MIQGKYVMTPRGAILFPAFFNHSDFRLLNITSAGFFMIDTDEDDISVRAFGNSLTLELCPDEMDAERIKQCFAN
jgi:hypothetical protein